MIRFIVRHLFTPKTKNPHFCGRMDSYVPFKHFHSNSLSFVLLYSRLHFYCLRSFLSWHLRKKRDLENKKRGRVFALTLVPPYIFHCELTISRGFLKALKFTGEEKQQNVISFLNEEKSSKTRG